MTTAAAAIASDATTPLLASARRAATESPRPALAARTLGDEFLRAIWIFQAGCALPILLILGTMAFMVLFDSRIPLYDFITYLGNALLAAGIVFLVVVQRRVPLDGVVEFRFEATKTFFATGMWLWLFLDALLTYPGNKDWPGWAEYRRRRAMRAGIASILLWILFYPPLGYACWVWLETRKRVRDGEGHGELDADVIEEDTHLLSQRS